MRDRQSDLAHGTLPPTFRSLGPESTECTFGRESSGAATLLAGHSVAQSNQSLHCAHIWGICYVHYARLSRVLLVWPQQVPEPLDLSTSVRAWLE